MVAKAQILAEIRRTANENGGSAPGSRLFETETGIPMHAWRGKYWRRWSDAVREAGLAPNEVNEPIPETELVTALVSLARKLGRFPIEVDLQMERVANPKFPSKNPFRRLGTQAARLEVVRAYAAAHPDCEDVLALLPPSADGTSEEATGEVSETVEGHVYLLKFAKHYKIGRSESVPTRHRQINFELPEKAELIHKIATDDTVGIEAYWHKRFAAKRTNGEWFALQRADVGAFRRRKFM